jgi:hypothetical protein
MPNAGRIPTKPAARGIWELPSQCDAELTVVLNLTVPVATAVVCTTIISWAVSGVGSSRDSKNPIIADCRDILEESNRINLETKV